MKKNKQELRISFSFQQKLKKFLIFLRFSVYTKKSGIIDLIFDFHLRFHLIFRENRHKYVIAHLDLE